MNNLYEYTFADGSMFIIPTWIVICGLFFIFLTMQAIEKGVDSVDSIRQINEKADKILEILWNK